MNLRDVDAIARAVLYEGYMLYPYRPSSVKNRQRFNFGVLYPQSHSEAQSGSEPCSMQCETLIESGQDSTVEVRIRFLHLVTRSIAKLASLPSSNGMPRFESVSTLEAGGKVHSPWQEAVECEVIVPLCRPFSLVESPVEWKFDFPAKEEYEELRSASEDVIGRVTRRRESISGVANVTATRERGGLFKIRVLVQNSTLTNTDDSSGRDAALSRSLVSSHILLGTESGKFVSLLEPPEDQSALAASCENAGVWPVLVGKKGDRDTVLASPIILYDYPEIAPESPGDLFDGTEIDEILALRILTMTDAEKREMRDSDERAGKMLDRTEALPMEQLMKLHGTLRELRPIEEDAS